MARCPICKRELPEPAPHRPFCTARCQEVDLGRWLDEAYRVSRPARFDEVEVPPGPEDPLPS